MKVFIADDSDVVRNRLKELLEEQENVKLIGEARDATEAIRLLETLKADIVILDIRMPGGNGMAVLKDLTARKDPPVVIIYTSFSYAQYRKAYLDAGADFFFDKARDTDEIIQVINQYQNNQRVPE